MIPAAAENIIILYAIGCRGISTTDTDDLIVCFIEVCAAEVCVSEVCTSEVCAAEVCVSEVCSFAALFVAQPFTMTCDNTI
jgi:hypothetical protein